MWMWPPIDRETMRRNNRIDALLGRAADSSENEARLERPGGKRSPEARIWPALSWIGLAVVLVIVAVNRKDARSSGAGPQFAKERSWEEDPSVVRPAAETEKRGSIAEAVAGAAAAHVPVRNAVDVVAVAAAGMYDAR